MRGDPRFADLLHARFPSLAAENIKKAYDLREQVSEREKYRISSMYYTYVTGELEQASQVYELWAKSYPQDAIPPGNLGDIYFKLGQYEKALNESEEAQRLEPDVVGYSNLVTAYLALNHPDDAKKTVEQAQERKFEGDTLHWVIYQLAFLKGDTAEMRRQVEWAEVNPGVKTSCSRGNPIPRHTTGDLRRHGTSPGVR